MEAAANTMWSASPHSELANAWVEERTVSRLLWSIRRGSER